MSDSVKPTRRYDATRRRDRARRAREEIIDAGSRLFLAYGFAATTVTAVAHAAGVSAETIYKSFGGKAGLVRAMWARALEGEGATPAEQRSDAMQATEHDPHKVIRQWGGFIVEVAPRVGPILLLIKSAASIDPEMADLLEEVDEQRLARMERNARTLHDRRQLQPGIALREARDILWTYSSPELFELLVVKRAWSIQRFGDFVADQLISALLAPPSDDDRSGAPP
jgi:AcrR family transcriptional regulator